MKRFFILLLVASLGITIGLSTVQQPAIFVSAKDEPKVNETVIPTTTATISVVTPQLTTSEPMTEVKTITATAPGNPTTDISTPESSADQTSSLESVSDTQPVEGTELSLQILSVTSPVLPGESAILRAHTVAGATCTISVYYTSTRSAAEGLNEKIAESSGNVSWTWKIGTDRTPGSYRIEVVATLGEKSISQTIYFDVG